MGANFVNESFDYSATNKSISIDKNQRVNSLRKTHGHKPVMIKINNKDFINNRSSEVGSLITV